MPKQYPKELKDRAVRLVLDHRDDYESQTEAIRVISERLDISRESLRRWVIRADVDAGTKPGATTAEQERIKALEREVRELKRSNEILKSAASFFARELDPGHRSL